MATAYPEEENDITKCSICLEQFKTPKYLPCLHTFCESYITSAFETAGHKQNTESGFNCPVCRSSTKPLNPLAVYSDWAGQFPLNHLIVTLIDQNRLKAKVKLCDPYKFESKDQNAVSWCTVCNEALCETCLNVHKKLRFSRNHFIQNIDDITAVPLITSYDFCAKHEGANINAFCVDHDQPCCTTCIAIHHRKCDHVTTLEEAADGASKSQLFADILCRLEHSDCTINQILNEKKENVDDLKKQKKRNTK